MRSVRQKIVPSSWQGLLSLIVYGGVLEMTMEASPPPFISIHYPHGGRGKEKMDALFPIRWKKLLLGTICRTRGLGGGLHARFGVL